MAIRGSSLAGAIIPVGGPAGLSGQSTYAAWLALGNTGSLADFMAAQKGAPGGVTTLAGKVGALGLDDIGALAKTGDASNTNIATTDGQTKTAASWLSNLGDALAYIPTLSARIKVAQWLDVPARPQWWGAACDGITDDTSALQSAINGAAAAGLRLLIAGTCLTGPLNVPSKAQISAGQAGGFKLKGSVGPILQIAAAADNVLVDGLAFDWSSIGDAAGDLACSAIGQAVGGNGGRITISFNRFNAPSLATAANNHAIMLNGANARIIGNYVEGTAGDSLNVNGGYSFIASNYVGRSGDGGIAFNNSARGVAVGNILVKCMLGIGVGPMGVAATTDHQQSLVLVANTIEGANLGVNMGWYAYAGREGPINWTIASNVFRNCKQGAIRYDGRALGWVVNGAITGNTITGTGATDFDGTQGSNANDIALVNASGATIVGNRMSAPRGTGTRYAIHLYGSQDVTVSGNSVNGTLDVNANGSTTSANVNRYDIVFNLVEAQGANISGNTARYSGIFAKLDLFTAGAAYDAIISGNQALDMNVQGLNFQKNGTGILISDNVLRTTGWGIYLPNTVGDLTVTDNIIASVNGQAIAAPSGVSTWTNWQINNNATGTGSVPVGATGYKVANGGQYSLTDSSGRAFPFPVIQSDDNIVFKGYTSDGTLQVLLAYQTNQASKGVWSFNTSISMGGNIALNGYGLTTVAKIAPTATGNLTLGNGSALATTATAGMILVPSGSGAPTGAPVGAQAGATPMYVDLTNLKLWFYIGSTWRGVALA